MRGESLDLDCCGGGPLPRNDKGGESVSVERIFVMVREMKIVKFKLKFSLFDYVAAELARDNVKIK